MKPSNRRILKQALMYYDEVIGEYLDYIPREVIELAEQVQEVLDDEEN